MLTGTSVATCELGGSRYLLPLAVDISTATQGSDVRESNELRYVDISQSENINAHTHRKIWDPMRDPVSLILLSKMISTATTSLKSFKISRSRIWDVLVHHISTATLRYLGILKKLGSLSS